MKKMILICLAVLMIVSMLAACGGKKKTKPEETEPSTDPIPEVTQPIEDTKPQDTEPVQNPDEKAEEELDVGIEEEDADSDDDGVIDFDDLLAAAGN